MSIEMKTALKPVFFVRLILMTVIFLVVMVHDVMYIHTYYFRRGQGRFRNHEQAHLTVRVATTTVLLLRRWIGWSGKPLTNHFLPNRQIPNPYLLKPRTIIMGRRIKQAFSVRPQLERWYKVVRVRVSPPVIIWKVTVQGRFSIIGSGR
jgi:hypothetical protein